MRARVRFVPPLAAALMLAGCGTRSAPADTSAVADAPSPDPSAPRGGWIRAVVATPDGGIRMGNPAARAALVEYGSYTCSHCAVFALEAGQGLRRLVATGRLSYEFRPFVRDSVDLAAALVARCGGATSFFAISDALFARQQEWYGNANTLTPGDQKKILALPEARQYPALAHAIGLTGYLGPSGVTVTAADACLADPHAQDMLAAIRAAAVKRYAIAATPTFLLNGKVIGSADWAGLRPQLPAG